MKTWSDYKISKVTPRDKNFPIILTKIPNPPKVLYYRGKLNNSLFNKSLAVVGSRRVTRYGKEITDKFVTDLVTKKVTIVSGFMYGVDTIAHQSTVDNAGATVAVFASGLNQIYPPENDKLYTKILELDGAVLSEYKPEQKPQLWAYPQRNRIVSGLSSLGVLVVEAGEKSGSLVTADLALKQNKKVFAIPGPIISSVSQGTNKLIKEGSAQLVTDPSDIFGSKQKLDKKKIPPDLSELETKIYKSLLAEELTIDELSADTGINIIKLSTTISMMSLKNLITESNSKYYISKGT